MSCNNIVQALTHKCFDLIIAELNKEDMKDTIRMKLINPLMMMIYKQLYPYIYTFIILFILMFLMLIALLISFFLHTKNK